MYVCRLLLRIRLLSMLLVVVIAQQAHAQDFTWAFQNTTGTGASHSHSITTDAAGNSFVLGGFDKTLRIGDSTFVTDDYNNDLYLAKYDSVAKLLWVRRMGSPA